MSKRNVNRKLKKQTEEDIELLSPIVDCPSTSIERPTASTSNFFDTFDTSRHTSNELDSESTFQPVENDSAEPEVLDETDNSPLPQFFRRSSSSSSSDEQYKFTNVDNNFPNKPEFDFDTFKKQLSSWAVVESVKQSIFLIY